MEASVQPLETMTDPFEREIDASLPVGEDRAAAMARCDYLLERIREERRREADVAEVAARRIQMVSDWGTEEREKIQRRIAHLEERLRMHVPASGAGMEREFGKKSVTLPHGTLGYKASPATVKIVDQKAVVAWATQAGVPVQQKLVESVLASDVKAHWHATGEIPDGCEQIDASESFYVKPREGA